MATRSVPPYSDESGQALFVYPVRTVQYNLDRISPHNSCWLGRETVRRPDSLR